MSKITPVGNRVLVKPAPKEEATKSGFIVPDTSINPPFFIGEITAISKETEKFKVGDTVAHKKYGMEILQTEDGDVYLVEENSIIATYS